MASECKGRVLSDDGIVLNVTGPVGFDRLPNQFVDYKTKLGYDLNILLMGNVGVGKSSFINTLFNKDFKMEPFPLTVPEDMDLKTYSFSVVEGSVTVRMNIVESYGYGEQIDRSNYNTVIGSYLDNQLHNYMKEEFRAVRNLNRVTDSRIHLCFYLIPATSQSLRILDLSTLKMLTSKTNVIPIISKADVLTKNELAFLKKTIMKQAYSNDINFYKFPTLDSLLSEKNAQINDLMPFTVISSNGTEEINGEHVRVRKFPWGYVNVDRDDFCDFNLIKEFCFLKNLHDFIDKTDKIFYHQFRETTMTSSSFDFNAYLNINNIVKSSQSDALSAEKRKLEEKYKAQLSEKLKEIEKETMKANENFTLSLNALNEQKVSFQNRIHTEQSTTTSEKSKKSKKFKK